MKIILVAEIGISHNGSLDIAKQLIDVAILGKCKYVKFQKRTIEDVYTPEELDKYRESPWGTTNREQKEGLEFDKEDFDEIDTYCKEKGIGWFASPWDIKSVDFLMQYNPDYIKVASAMLTNTSLLEHINKCIEGTETKIILATGMSTEEEILDCLQVIEAEYILSCTSSYPTPNSELNINKIRTFKSLLPTDKIGFSNHAAGLTGMIMAATMGAEMIEYHITLDRSMYGSDQSASIETTGAIKLGNYIEAVEQSLGDGEIGIMPSEVPIREKLRKI